MLRGESGAGEQTPEIEIIVDLDGGYEVDGKHFKGTECDSYLPQLAAALGTVDEDEKKPEYFVRDDTSHRETVKEVRRAGLR